MSQPYYPDIVKKQFQDANIAPVVQDDIATDATGTVIAGAVNGILAVLEALGLREEEPEG